LVELTEEVVELTEEAGATIGCDCATACCGISITFTGSFWAVMVSGWVWFKVPIIMNPNRMAAATPDAESLYMRALRFLFNLKLSQAPSM